MFPVVKCHKSLLKLLPLLQNYSMKNILLWSRCFQDLPQGLYSSYAVPWGLLSKLFNKHLWSLHARLQEDAPVLCRLHFKIRVFSSQHWTLSMLVDLLNSFCFREKFKVFDSFAILISSSKYTKANGRTWYFQHATPVILTCAYPAHWLSLICHFS